MLLSMNQEEQAKNIRVRRDCQIFAVGAGNLTLRRFSRRQDFIDYRIDLIYNYEVIFDWDENKAKSNLRKHKVDFTEAASVFDDPFSITISDPDHSRKENRFIDIGRSDKNHLLVVVYTEREERIRIISARPATAPERKKYEEERSY